ncbi:MAG: hypothetical protein EB015_14700 [Methylocystaceae bacterium]|jgi:hypothetical protein|nr:hypothetical protein [Methylocystaceae bacterium]
MADDDFEYVEGPNGEIIINQDKISARTMAYVTLMIETTKIVDPDIKAESLEMLKRLRMSMPAYSEATLGVVKGGKS